MKEKMRKIVKGMAVAAIAVSVIFGSVSSPARVEAKGTAFVNKKVSSVTPTIKSAKRSKGKTTVTVSVPTSKVKKLGKVKKITVAYGSTKNSKKFEAKKLQAKVTKKGKKQYTFTVNNKKLASYKNAYITVRFDGKSNWSKLVKVSGKATKSKPNDATVWVECNTCHKRWEKNCPADEISKTMDELIKVLDKHQVDSRSEEYYEALSHTTSFEEMCEVQKRYRPCGNGYTSGYTVARSN